MLPDENITTVGADCFHYAEVWYQLSFTGKETSGFFDTSFQNIMKCDVYIRTELHANVVLPGGTTMFQDIGEHMPTTSAPEAMQIKVVCSSKV